MFENSQELIAEEEKTLLLAIKWKYSLKSVSDVQHKRRQLRQTDIIDLLWEYEDFLASDGGC